jgi:hypothetical protein
MKFGPDISHWQTAVDLKTTVKHVDFVILKASEGLSYVDPTFVARWAELGRLRTPRAAYHFARPETSATSQAAHFIATVKRGGWKRGDAAVLDFESAPANLSPAVLYLWAAQWVKQVRDDLAVPQVVFYTYIPFWRDRMGNPATLPANTVGWVARYHRSGPYAPPYARPRAWPDPPDIWQQTNGTNGRTVNVPGIGRCDYNQMTDSCYAQLFNPAPGDEDDDMPLSPEDIRKVAEASAAAVWHSLIPVPGGGREPAGNFLHNLTADVRNALERVRALETSLGELDLPEDSRAKAREHLLALVQVIGGPQT